MIIFDERPDGDRLRLMSSVYGSKGYEELHRFARNNRLPRKALRFEGHPAEEHYAISKRRAERLREGGAYALPSRQVLAMLRDKRLTYAFASAPRPALRLDDLREGPRKGSIRSASLTHMEA